MNKPTKLMNKKEKDCKINKEDVFERLQRPKSVEKGKSEK